VLPATHGAPQSVRVLLINGLMLTAGRPSTRVQGLLHLYLGDPYHGCGEPSAACDHWQEAQAILTGLADSDAAQADRRLSPVE
jgi:hypothetical protein